MAMDLLESRLLARLAERAAEPAGPARIAPRRSTDPVPLSFAQQRLWFLDQLEPGSAEYLVPFAVRVSGGLDVSALGVALSGIVARHEVLRTRFVPDQDGDPQQIVDAPWPVTATVHDLRHGTEDASAREQEAVDLLRARAREPFDLASGRLLRADVVVVGEDEQFLLLALHHIVSDGWSEGILAHELDELYAAAVEERAAALPELPVQYADYAAWQREQLAGGRVDAQLGYWRERLAGLEPLELPVDHARPAERRADGDTVFFDVPAEVVGGLRGIAARGGASLFMVLLAGFEVLLSKVSGQVDVAVGTPIAGRTCAEVEGLVGFFVNTLVMRGDVSGDPSFGEVVRRVRESVLGAFDHQDLPFERLVEELAPERDLSRNPLFQAMMVFQSAGDGSGDANGGDAASPWTFSGTRTTPVEFGRGYAKFDLTLTFAEDGSGLSAGLEYRTDLFDRGTAERFARCLEVLLASVAVAAEVPVSRVEWVPAGELARVVSGWNRTEGWFPDGATIHGLIRDRVSSSTDDVAVACGEQSLSFGEVWGRAESLARYLVSTGVGPGSLVGVCLDRGPELVCALVGVMLAGAAFVPVDPEYPLDRIGFILEDTAAPVVITQGSYVDRLPESASVLLVDGVWPSADAVLPEVAATELAYVIYTSGSTGRPKGVLLEHRGVVNYLHWCDVNYPPVGPHGVGSLLYSSVSFDLTITALFLPLMQGQRLVIPVPAEGGTVFDAAVEFVATGEPIGFFKATPSHLEVLAGHLESLGARHAISAIVAGGEDLTPTLVERVLATSSGKTVISNEYGATECSVANVMSLTTAPEQGSHTTSVGLPITNTTAYVVDRFDRPVPVGVVGECLLGGVAVARGYLNRPELTAARFVDLDLGDGVARRVYRTGDLVKRRTNGELEFVGRIDDQVKVRGYRIELGEIESQVLAHPLVAAASVIVRQDTPGDKRLVGYFVPLDGSAAPSTEDLRAFLSLTLPEYMVPCAFVALDALPLTPNGKVDRKALPAPGLRERGRGETYAAPRTDLESALTVIWSELLSVTPVGIHDNFFHLGGHSLLATRLVSRLRKVLGVEVPVRTVFSAPTPARLAAAIEAIEGTADDAPITRVARDGSPLPLSFAQQRLWFLDQLEPGSAEYLIPFAVRVTGELDVSALGAALSGIVARHEVLRTRFVTDEDGRAGQFVDPPAPVDVTVHDLRHIVDAETRHESALELLGTEGARPFDLASGRLLRADVVVVGDDEQFLLLALHHIVSDGWSEGVLWNELVELYSAALEGRAAVLPELPVQYADYSVWQRDRLSGAVLDEQLGYWREHLAGLEPLELPLDHARPVERGTVGDSVRFQIPAEVVGGLRSIASDGEASLFMVLLAAFEVLLSKVSGQVDVAVGTPIAGRTCAEVEGLVGFFVNTLVMRGDVSGDPSFGEVVRRVRESVLGAFDHQDLPFERLVEELAPERDLSRNPLFQAMFVMQNVPEGESRPLSGARAVEPVSVRGQLVKFDLQLALLENGDELEASLEFRTDLFDRGTAERFARCLEVLLASVAVAAEVPVSRVEWVPAGELARVVSGWNETEGWFPDGATIHGLIRDRVGSAAGDVAVVYGDQSSSFGEVWGRAESLARYLVSTGVGPGSLVGVCLDRGPELVCALVGVMLAGAAFVPVDPEYPLDRIGFILEDTAAPVVITQGSHVDCLPESASILLVDGVWPSADAELPEIAATELAYVIYTSGSTGRPKGVLLEHRGVVNYLHWCDLNYPPVGPNGVGSLLYSSVSFDLTITALFLPLIQGQRLVIPVPAEGGTVFDAAIEFVATGEPIGFFKATPSHLEVLAGHLELAGARHAISSIVAGGEDLTPTLVEKILRTSSVKTVISNEYGATECSVANVMSLTTAPEQGSHTTSVGLPITNTTAYVVDRFDRPVPVGVVGECLLGGVAVARGYLNRPELTAARFVDLDLGDGVARRVYRTGDLVKRRTNGELEFVGRIDDQVKVRGYRIELGEIESQLQAHPLVGAAAVIVRQDTPGDKRLVGYFVPLDGSAAPSTENLRTFLAQTLPEYMVPSAFVALDMLPLTPNGKVDRKALPAPDPRERGTGNTYVAPRTELEHTLAAIWSEILGVTPVGIHDNFFQLGGDSIVSIQMIARAKKHGLHLTPRMIFKYQTIAEIAPHVRTEAVVDAEQGLVTGDVRLTPIQQWFLEKRLPSAHHFNQAELLVTDGLDPAILVSALGDVLGHHDALRLRYRRDAATDTWTQYLDDAISAADLLLTHDLTAVPDADLSAATQRIGEATQQSFDLEAGPLLRCALIDLGPRDTGTQRLLIAVHHLAIDSVSWRVLLEDLGAAYAARALGQAPNLPEKTTSFKAWAEKLAAHAVSERARAEFAYWAEPKPEGGLPRDHADGANTGDSADTVQVSLDARETGALLREVPRAFATRINDALLTALAHAVGRWTGERRTLIGLEGHGREDLFADTDLSRTVGWFTSVFPVVLDADPAADPVESLAAVQAQLARIPDNGVGYGILRYLGDADTAPTLQAQPYPEINVNYLGQFAESLPGIGRYADPAESRGRSVSPDGPRWNVLDVTGAVEGDVFNLYLTYSEALHDRATVERLAADILAVLRRLIEAAAQDPAERTRADRATEGTALTDVSDSDLAAILKRFSA